MPCYWSWINLDVSKRISNNIVISIECKTIGGPSPNTTCVFPFKHQNKVYNGCTLDKDGYWCSTKVDLFGRHVGKEKNWGICGIGCPKQGIQLGNLNNMKIAS